MKASIELKTHWPDELEPGTELYVWVTGSTMRSMFVNYAPDYKWLTEINGKGHIMKEDNDIIGWVKACEFWDFEQKTTGGKS